MEKSRDYSRDPDYFCNPTYIKHTINKQRQRQKCPKADDDDDVATGARISSRQRQRGGSSSSASVGGGVVTA